MSGITIPFSVEFQLMPADPNRPTLQSYSWLRDPSVGFYMLGGRLKGLHQFKIGTNNFPDPNQTLWYCNPRTGAVNSLLDLKLLDPEIGDPLMATNQQFYHDVEAGLWLIVGGYGVVSALGQSRTFDTLISIPVDQFIHIVHSGRPPPQMVAALERIITVQRDPFFAVTGGALRKLGGRYLLAFGQGFQGAYNPFVGIVAQEYTDAVRFFRLDGWGRAFGMGELRSRDPDKPFHRRDGPIIDSVRPSTGQPCVIGFGGVFPPGMLDGYMNPVYIEEQACQLVATTDRSVTQLFCHYECPTVVVWDPLERAVYHTFFGGISRSYYWQTQKQNSIYNQVTEEGRNDGLPFVADISTLVLFQGGQSSEWISPKPIPNYSLHGASADFIPLPNARNPWISREGVINLQQLPPGGSPVEVGYIYGGIEANYPLPVKPNEGTAATSNIYQVSIIPLDSSGYIPSSKGILANGVLTPPIVKAS
jgi:hypothetical protein